MFFQIASVFADHFGTAWIDVADPIFGETGIEAAIQTFLAKLCMVIRSLQGPTSKLVFGRPFVKLESHISALRYSSELDLGWVLQGYFDPPFLYFAQRYARRLFRSSCFSENTAWIVAIRCSSNFHCHGKSPENSESCFTYFPCTVSSGCCLKITIFSFVFFQSCFSL